MRPAAGGAGALGDELLRGAGRGRHGGGGAGRGGARGELTTVVGAGGGAGRPDLGRLRVAGVRLVRVELPLARPVRTALAGIDARDVLLVHVRGADGEEGWGECSAESTPGYWHEHTAGCEDVLARWVVPRLEGATVGLDGLPAVPGWPMASAAVAWSVLDALCRRAEIPVAAWLGGVRPRVEATLTLGLEEPPDAGPYRNVKLKIAPSSLPRSLPAGVRASADANGTLTSDDVAALAGIGLDHLEQPLPADDLVGHARLRAAHPGLPIALDEPVRSPGDVRTIAALGAADAVVLKPGRVGGPLGAVAVHDAAVAAGLAVKVGGMWDTGIGRAAALAVAALPGCTLAPDLAAADRYFADDVVAEPVTLDADGCLAVPTRPGLGIDVTV